MLLGKGEGMKSCKTCVFWRTDTGSTNNLERCVKDNIYTSFNYSCEQWITQDCYTG